MKWTIELMISTANHFHSETSIEPVLPQQQQQQKKAEEEQWNQRKGKGRRMKLTEGIKPGPAITVKLIGP